MKVMRTERSPPRTSLSWKWKQEIARWDSSWKNANSHIWAKLMHTTVGDGHSAEQGGGLQSPGWPRGPRREAIGVASLTLEG